ncbi:hypothetical protein AB0C02_32460 [Micromonospora sp. NPDC048999]|uniref:hypothetical protein n=1 Tax=Micromonospora sp. NPDC048999 TaxID=3155391 RepID=UPI0033FE7FF4
MADGLERVASAVGIQEREGPGMRLRVSAMGAIALSLVVLVGLGACSEVSCGGGDYPIYSSVDDLYRAATLVVWAQIPGPPESRRVKTGPGPTMEYKVYRAQVGKVFKGTPGAATVEIKQLACREGSGPGLAVGTTYVLFLETYADVPASLLNPIQAEYTVDSSGQLVSASGNALTLTMADLERLSRGS